MRDSRINFIKILFHFKLLLLNFYLNYFNFLEFFQTLQHFQLKIIDFFVIIFIIIRLLQIRDFLNIIAVVAYFYFIFHYLKINQCF